MDQEKPLLEFTTHYKPLYTFLQKNGIMTFILILAAFGLYNSEFANYYFMIIGAYLVYVILSNIYYYFNYRNIHYTFFSDHFLIQKKVFILKEDVIPYVWIRDIKYRQELAQIFFKTGDILVTYQTGNIFKRGTYIMYVDNVIETFNKLYDIMVGQAN